MIHYQRLAEIQEEIQEKQLAIMIGDLDDEDIQNYQSDIQALEDEQRELEAEQEEYREGYHAGMEFHMGSGVMLEEWRGRTDKFQEGFDAAGQDS